MSIAAACPTEIIRDPRPRNIRQLTPDQTIIPNLPNDVASEILARLPHECLFKFSCVCKTWQSLFLNRSFIKLHEDNQNESLFVFSSVDMTSSNYYLSSLLYTKNPKTIVNLDHPFHLLSEGMDVVGSINGLICLGDKNWAQNIVIWNPLTNQYRYSPTPKFKYNSGNMNTISLGFCFDSLMSDYVVVRIARFQRNSKLVSRVELYSLNSDSWRELKNYVDFPILFSKCATIVKGKPYWWARYKLDGPTFIVRFDIHDKMFRRVPMFRATYKELMCCKLVSYKSLLAVLVDSNLSFTSLFHKLLGISSLEVREERTLTMFVLGNDGIWHVSSIGFPQGIEKVIGCSNNGKVILEDESGMMALFDTKAQKIEKIHIVGARAVSSFTVCNYNASLVPIKDPNEIRNKNMKTVTWAEKQGFEIGSSS